MSRLYRKFKTEQPEAQCEGLEPAFKKLCDRLHDLADRITAEIAQESAGDPVKTLRCEWAFFWEPSRTELEKTLDQAESASLSISFRKNPPTARERALSAADRFIDQALFDVNIFGNRSYATEDYANA